MSNIQININQPSQLCQLKPLAFITILQHTHRFWAKDALNGNSKYAYGILVGTVEGDVRTITEVVPVLHVDHADHVFNETFFKHWDDLNKLKEELEVNERCLGWYKVIDRDMKFLAPDIRNQVKIQTLGPKNIALLIDPARFLEDQDYGFSIFHLQSSGGLVHEMCDYERIPWEIMELGNDVDKTVNLVLEMIRNFNTSNPFVEEIDEFKMPEIIDDGNAEDTGEYVTPDIDPNQPYFF